MSSLSRIRIVKSGLHTTNVQWEADTSVSYINLEPVGDVSLDGLTIGKNADLSMRNDGEMAAATIGVKSTKIAIPLRVRGINGGAGSATAAARLTKTEIGHLLDSLCGADGVDGTGTTITGGNAVTPTLIVSDTTGFPPGNAVMFDANGELVIREVVSRSTTSGAGTLTLCRAYTGSPINGGVAYASATWRIQPAAINPKHLALDVQGDGDRYKLLGMMGGFSFGFPAQGGVVTMNLDLEGTHWTRESTGLTFTAPTVGSAIPAIDASFFVGANEYDLKDAAFTVEVSKQKREHYAGINGFTGFDVIDRKAKFNGKLRAGALSGEVGVSLLDTLRSATTQDVLLQVGRTAGAAMAIRFPNFDFAGDSVKRVIDNGREAIDFSGQGARSSNQANVAGACRIHLF